MEATSKKSNEDSVWGRRIHFLIDMFASIFWLYAIIKLFIFDIDVWLFSFLPSTLAFILKYKLLILLFLASFLIIVFRKFPLALAVFYVTLFPIIIIGWKIPRIVWNRGSWLLAFVFINGVISFMRSFKEKFILITLFLIFSTMIALSKNAFILYSSSAILGFVISYFYFSSIVRAFKSSAVYQAYKAIFPMVHKSELLKVDRSLTLLADQEMTKDQVTIKTNSLQNIVLYNRFCLFVSRRLRDYQKSRLNTISQIGGLILLLVFTIVVFSLVNYAIYKIDPSNYQFIYSKPSFFAFAYYATGGMFYASNGLVPSSTVSQAIQIFQFLFSVLLMVIFAAILIAMKNEKNNHELNEVIESAEREGRDMDSLITDSFNVSSVEAAIEALQNAKAGMVGIIIAVTRNLDKPTHS